MHLLRNGAGDLKISLEDLRVEGATLILSSHIQLGPNVQVEQFDPIAQLEQEDRMKHLCEFWDDYMKVQKEKLGLNNPLTMEQLEKSLELIQQEKIKFADPENWSEENLEYNQRFEDSLFDNPFDDWEDEEDD